MKMELAKKAKELVEDIESCECDIDEFVGREITDEQDVEIHQNGDTLYLGSIYAIDVKNLIISRRNKLSKRLAQLK